MTWHDSSRPRASVATWLLIGALGIGGTVRAAETADSLLQRVRATYGALSSYSDRGVVLSEYGPASSPGRSRHTFTTYFSRSPRHFYFDFHKEGGDRLVIWADPGAFHSWWRTTGVRTDYANPNNVGAINLNDFPTSGSATKVAPLLYPKAPLMGAVVHLTGAVMDGTEEIGGNRCLRVVGRTSDSYGQTGKEVNARKLSVWIDAKTWLVRQTREETKATPTQIDRLTTTFDPTANPVLRESLFTFSPPGQP